MKHLLTFIIGILIFFQAIQVRAESNKTTWWQIQSIDTMKFSRDLSREKLTDAKFITTIQIQIADIANTNATHVAIATPYDEEFLPFLNEWVNAARLNNLNVWFRGNFSGWEKWFDYPQMSAEDHHKQIEKFILKHPDFFRDGDIFSTCPECENGGPGDPRKTGNVEEYRRFLIDEYNLCVKSFKKINKTVACNFFSMNADVAKTVMDKETTASIGGLVTIDHYVKSADQLVSDIRYISEKSGGKVMLGEFGAPIPDIHGNMDESDQALWISDALSKLEPEPELIGVNYWLNSGGSTAIWNENGSAKKSVGVIMDAYTPRSVNGLIINSFKQPLAKVLVSNTNRSIESKTDGTFSFPYINEDLQITFSKAGYETRKMTINEALTTEPITLKPISKNYYEYFRAIILAFLHL